MAHQKLKEHFHLAVEGRLKRVLVPVYLHVEAQDAVWWKKSCRKIRADLVRLLADNVQDIEAKFWDIFGSNYGSNDAGIESGIIDQKVLNLTQTVPPTRLLGSNLCIIAYSVSGNSKYSVLTLHDEKDIINESEALSDAERVEMEYQQQKKRTRINSTEFNQSGSCPLNNFLENEISSFIVSVYLFPPNAETRYPQGLLPIFA